MHNVVVPIVPSREWALTHGPPNPLQSHSKPSLLGLSMRMCEPETSLDNVWHVLDVLEGSPAESAGLVPYGDWIIGWSGGVLRAEGDFYDVVESVSICRIVRNNICLLTCCIQHIEKPLRVYVYSYDFEYVSSITFVNLTHLSDVKQHPGGGLGT